MSRYHTFFSLNTVSLKKTANCCCLLKCYCAMSSSLISPSVLSFSHISVATVSAPGDKSIPEFTAAVPRSETTWEKLSDHWVYKRISLLQRKNHWTPSSFHFWCRNDKYIGPHKICRPLFLGDSMLIIKGAMGPIGACLKLVYRLTSTTWWLVLWVTENVK